MASSESNTNVPSAQTSSSEMSGKIVNDIVHGIIELPEYIRIIIDTEQFQRLRYISQLGVAKFVYPSAGYCRFEHSIGTFHLASKLVKQIKQQLFQENSEISVTDEDVKCVEIAALCHDLGHGPYSHFWEQAFDESIPARKHEVLSVEIFEELIKNEISGKTIRDRISECVKDIGLIGRIISGKMDPTKDKDKFFLFEIVANKKSGLDVDKFDYLCRDSIYLGWSNKNKIHDVKRIMRFLRVVKDQNNEWHLAMRDREIFHIHDVFYYRHLLHRYGYQHKTVKAVECLFKQAIKIIVDKHRQEFIDSVLGDTKNDKYDVNIWFSTNFISKVCDHHLWEMMKKHTSGIVKQIQERNMIKLHCQIQVIHKDTDQAKYLESVKKLEEIPDFGPENNLNWNIQDDMKSLITFLKESLSCIGDIATSKFSFQSEGKGNPLLAVRFYKKDKESKCFYLKEEDLPNFVKLEGEEFIMMIFRETNENKQNISRLDKIIKALYVDENSFNTMQIEEGVKGKIKEFREHYKFRKNLY